MGIFDYISTFIVLVPVIVIVVLFVVKRGKYKNKSNAGAFFFRERLPGAEHRNSLSNSL